MKRILLILLTLFICFTSCSLSENVQVNTNTHPPAIMQTEEVRLAPSETIYSGNLYAYLDSKEEYFNRTKVVLPVLPTEELQLSLESKISKFIAESDLPYEPDEIDFYCESAFSTVSFVFYVSDSTEAYDNDKMYFSYNTDTLRESEFRDYFNKYDYTQVCIKYFGKENPEVERFTVNSDGITAFYDSTSCFISSEEFDKDYNLYVFHPDDYSPVTVLDDKYVAITFDDGPNPQTTPGLIEMLKEKGVKATFFMVGYNISAFPSVVKNVYDNGHDIGIHSSKHSNYSLMKSDEVIEDIDKCSDMLYKIIKKRPYLVRPPYGSIKIDEINTKDYFFVNWNVDTLDWKSESPEQIAESALKSIRSGSIILLHDIYQTSCDAAGLIIDKLLEDGYRFVTISEFYDLNGKETDSKLHYFSGDYHG